MKIKGGKEHAGKRGKLELRFEFPLDSQEVARGWKEIVDIWGEAKGKRAFRRSRYAKEYYAAVLAVRHSANTLATSSESENRIGLRFGSKRQQRELTAELKYLVDTRGVREGEREFFRRHYGERIVGRATIKTEQQKGGLKNAETSNRRSDVTRLSLGGK